MAREELVSSAVSFLQDPSVASSPIEKRIAFLRSKNLTQEEIDLALSRVTEEPSSSTAVVSSQPYATSQQTVHRQATPPQAYGYSTYGQWQPSPPEPPRRDWRDWFIMATVMGGVGYGIYVLAKRYVVPLIAPPTPPQLEQDKEHIDEQFSRAFSLIEQLSTDTAALKSAEDARTERLDAALKDVENLVADLKSASRRRDDEARRINDEVRALKDAIPTALEGAREGNENRLKELSTELRSLKILLGHRLGGSASSSPGAGRAIGASSHPGTPRPAEESANGTAASNGMSLPAATEQESATNSTAKAAQSALPAPQTHGNTSLAHGPLSQLGRSASIPAWQMAAANRSKTAAQPTSDSTVSPAAPAAPSNEQQSSSAN